MSTHRDKPPSPHSASLSPPQRHSVLVVEDDSDLCYLLGLMFSDAGYQVEEETSLDRAVVRLGSEPLPDLVVLDIVLGTSDASLLARRLCKNVPILLISARIKVEDLAKEVGCPGLAKPFTTEQLLASAAEALAQYQPGAE